MNRVGSFQFPNPGDIWIPIDNLLHLDGKDLTAEALLKRRARLPRVLEGSGVLLSEELPGTVAAIVEAVRGLGLEGVVAKRKDSIYEPGERSDGWQKLKLENQQEFVIGGYRPGSNGRRCSARRLLR